MEHKTQTFIVTNDNLFTGCLGSLLNTHAQDAESINPPPVTKKVNVKSIKHINPYYNFFPRFYKQELQRAFFIAMVWGVIAFCCLTGAVTIFCLTRGVNDGFVKVGVPIFLVLGLITVLVLFINYNTKYRLFRDEAKSVNFKDEKVIPVNILRVYKNAKTGYIKANWICGLVYLCSFIGACTILVISACLYGFDKEAINICFTLTNPPLFYSTLIVISASILALILHGYIVIGNYLRAAVIDNFYNTYIVSNEEIGELKKQINKKYMIIFAVCTFIFAWIATLIYKKTKTVIKNLVSLNKTKNEN